MGSTTSSATADRTSWRDGLRHWLAARRSSSPLDSQDPIREELFSAERIEEHARSLAAAQPVTPAPIKGRSLAARLAENDAVLLEAYRSLVAGIDEARGLTPAAEWLIDNFADRR